ncbi:MULTISPECIES: hypothetical protein [unclassified Haloarcula]|uniref:hypothetical protein n=1 Tax=unclassified Haloarcula TaxID=2624677 RepID=UPI000A96EE85|nr:MULTISPECIES: hypothetical protein [unclassified Haloarcula]
MGYFDNLNLDTWFKAVTYLGGIIVILSLTVDLQVVSNEIMAATGFGMFLYGVGRWKNQKTHTQFVPGGKLSWKERNSDIIGLLLEISGILMVIGAIGYVFLD